MIANPSHKTIDDLSSTGDLISSIFLHGAIVCRLTNPCRDILNQLQSHNKVCCNNLDRLRIWNDWEHKYCGRTCIDWRSRWSSYYIAFNDGTSMIDELSICKMDRINITKNCCNFVRTIKKISMALNCLIIKIANRISGRDSRMAIMIILSFHDSEFCQISYTCTLKVCSSPVSIFRTSPSCWTSRYRSFFTREAAFCAI